MNQAPRCRICQAERRQGEDWFLLIDNDWEDRLKIVVWCEALAARDETYAACSPSHVQRLVAHWMATGSLDYPFARVIPRSARTFTSLEELHSPSNGCRDVGSIQELGELAVDRDTLHRLFLENPDSLVPVLDALMSALHTNVAGELAGFSLAVDDPDTGNLPAAQRTTRLTDHTPSKEQHADRQQLAQSRQEKSKRRIG